ncbi:hypothetical protein N9452_09335 [Alphaproteobacteria bacterium]|nr:hypothetical protein [Alphaproteobacteria bacterium]
MLAVDKMLSRLKRKQKILEKRKKIALGLTKTPGFEELDLSRMPDLLALIKTNRWSLHARAAEFNLNIAKRRSHLTQRSDLQSFTGQSDTYLAISRAALMIYATGNSITAAECTNIVKGVNIHRASVYKYLKDAVAAGIYEETTNDAGVKCYNLSASASEEQFENLLELIFNPITFDFVQAMHRIYGAARVGLNKDFRRDTSMAQYFLDLVEDKEDEKVV